MCYTYIIRKGAKRMHSYKVQQGFRLDHDTIEKLRDQKKQAEIDLLIENGGKFHPIEIKMTAHPSVDMVRHFAELKKLDVPTSTGALICMTPQRRFLSDDVVTHSLWQI